MKLHGMCVALVALFLAASLQAAIPPTMPEISLAVSPEEPTSADPISLTLSTTWPNSCVPEGFQVNFLGDFTIGIDLLLPGWDTKGDCEDLICLPVLTPWQQTKVIESLSPGDYDVFLRPIACQETGPYEQIGTFSVQPRGRFLRGERVVLLQDEVEGGDGLTAGQAGTVICFDSNGASDSVLISWDLWAQGKDEKHSCEDEVAPILYPPNSGLWVDPDMVLIGRQFNWCGTIRKGLEGCVYFESDDGQTYNVMLPAELYAALDGKEGTIRFGDYVRLRGLLNQTPPAPDEIRICPQHDGDIYHPILTPCPTDKADCCGSLYQSGDRVVLLTDNPVGPDGLPAIGLPAGSLGTVVCCSDRHPLFPVLVSWDNWEHGGKVDTSACPAQAAAYPEQSLWLMACDQIAPAPPDEPKNGPDEIIIDIGGSPLVLKQDPQNPDAYAGCMTLTLELNFQAQLSVQIFPAPGVGGDWTGTLSPDVVGPGLVSTELCVQVENLNVSALPPGFQQVATVSLLAAPAS